MVITSARREELRTLHRIVYKCIDYMVRHYREYVPRYMPLSDREMEILEMQSRAAFRAGTYRPDYLISDSGDLLLCEITSRFFAHGIFMSYFSECAADAFLKNLSSRSDGKKEAASPQIPRRDSTFEQMLQYMLEITGNKKEIYILKSADKTSEIGLYVPFYEYYGKKAVILEAEEVEENISCWRNGFVISALNQTDLLSFSMETIEAMVAAGMYNDLRTILLIHDKRFMRLWFEDAFTGRFLTEEETTFLRRHTIPTWLYPDESAGGHCSSRHSHFSEETEAAWRDARRSREKYILKHHRLGKSEQVYAGPLTDERTWQSLWETGAVRQMILQPFIRQRTYSTIWEGQQFEDYICGMMLCVDDRYFESGMFRASSLPVTNVGDDRKICPLHTDEARIIQVADLL